MAVSGRETHPVELDVVVDRAAVRIEAETLDGARRPRHALVDAVLVDLGHVDDEDTVARRRSHIWIGIEKARGIAAGIAEVVVEPVDTRELTRARRTHFERELGVRPRINGKAASGAA